MLELTKKADYALRLMVDVAASQSGAVTTAEVAEREDIPYPFLRKVARDLVSAGLLQGRRGIRGGLSLAHAADTISLLEVLRAVDEPTISKCLIDPSACNRRSRCAIYPVWRRIQLELERALEAVSLAELAERHRRSAEAPGGGSDPAKRPPKETPKVSSLSPATESTVQVAEGRVP